MISIGERNFDTGSHHDINLLFKMKWFALSEMGHFSL